MQVATDADSDPSERLAVVVGVDAGRAAAGECPAPPEDGVEAVFVLDRSPMLVGRAEPGRVDIPVSDDPAVSRRHAEILRVAAGWAIRDIGSGNGTRVNGIEVNGAEPTPIGPGDVIELGCFSRLEVRGAGEGESALKPATPAH